MIITQGIKYILLSAIVTFVLFLLDLEILSFLALVLTLFLGYVYRNPSRHIFNNDKYILSPVDGIVEAIDNVHGKYKIYCKVSLCDVHNVKAPVGGEMKIKKHHKGLNLDPNSFKGSLLNEQVIFKFHHLKLKLVGGLCNPSIKFTSKHNVEQGDNIAVLVDGIAIVTIKDTHELDITIGEKLTAGQTKITFK